MSLFLSVVDAAALQKMIPVVARLLQLGFGMRCATTTRKCASSSSTRSGTTAGPGRAASWQGRGCANVYNSAKYRN